MNCYNVVRFNGPNQDCVMKSHLDYESAKKIEQYLNRINKKPEIRYKVIEYLVPMTREELFSKYEDSICELCKLNRHCKTHLLESLVKGIGVMNPLMNSLMKII